MDESRRLAMRRAHAKHADHCSCGRIVHGNGGRASHRYMHGQRGDGHGPVLWYVWPFMFPGHDGRKPHEPALTLTQAIEAELAHRTARILPSVSGTPPIVSIFPMTCDCGEELQSIDEAAHHECPRKLTKDSDLEPRDPLEELAAEAQRLKLGD